MWLFHNCVAHPILGLFPRWRWANPTNGDWGGQRLRPNLELPEPLNADELQHGPEAGKVITDLRARLADLQAKLDDASTEAQDAHSRAVRLEKELAEEQEVRVEEREAAEETGLQHLARAERAERDRDHYIAKAAALEEEVEVTAVESYTKATEDAAEYLKSIAKEGAERPCPELEALGPEFARLIRQAISDTATTAADKLLAGAHRPKAGMEAIAAKLDTGLTWDDAVDDLANAVGGSSTATSSRTTPTYACKHSRVTSEGDLADAALSPVCLDCHMPVHGDPPRLWGSPGSTDP